MLLVKVAVELERLTLKCAFLRSRYRTGKPDASMAYEVFPLMATFRDGNGDSMLHHPDKAWFRHVYLSCESSCIIIEYL